MVNKFLFVLGAAAFCVAFMGLESNSFGCLRAMSLGAAGGLLMAYSGRDTGWFE